MMNSRYYLVVSSLLLCSCRDRLEEENPRESTSIVLLCMLPQGLNAPSQAMKLLGLKECLPKNVV